MSPASHMVGRLRKLYGAVLGGMHGRDERRGHCRRDSADPMSPSIVEPLEPRVLLSASLGSSEDVAAVAHTTAILQSISSDINSPPVGAFTPSQIRSAYGFDQVLFGSVAGTGNGQTIAIVDAYDDPTALYDVNQFSSQFGLPLFNVTGGPTFLKFGQTGGAVPGVDSDGPAGTTGKSTWDAERECWISWGGPIAGRGRRG